MPSGSIVQQRPGIGFAFEFLTVSNTSTALTVATYGATSKRAETAYITVEGEIRYRYDGQDPTASVGHFLSDGGYLVLRGVHQMDSFRCIRTGNVDAQLSVTYERE